MKVNILCGISNPHKYKTNKKQHKKGVKNNTKQRYSLDFLCGLCYDQ